MVKVDAKLIKRAKRIGKKKTFTETAIAALTEYILRRKEWKRLEREKIKGRSKQLVKVAGKKRASKIARPNPNSRSIPQRSR